MARDRAGGGGGGGGGGEDMGESERQWAAAIEKRCLMFDPRWFSRTIDARTATQRARNRRAKRIVVKRAESLERGFRDAARRFFCFFFLKESEQRRREVV